MTIRLGHKKFTSPMKSSIIHRLPTLKKSYFPIPSEIQNILQKKRHVNTKIEEKVPLNKSQFSKIGFGSYRIKQDNRDHQEALELALRNGVNVIDTSSHFQNGSSERLIGETITKLTKSKELKRESLTIMTKAGHVLNPDRNVYDRHSIEPKFIQQQISQSLKNLNLDYLDVFFLNSPERLISLERKTNQETMYHIKTAFEFLENLVSQGILKSYGICSTSILHPSTQDHLNPLTLIKSRKNFPNFKCFQYPFNLFEFKESFELGRMLKEDGFLRFTHRPVNCLSNHQHNVVLTMKMKFDVNKTENALMNDISDLVLELEELENKYLYTPELEQFLWSSTLSENMSRLTDNYIASMYYTQQHIMTLIYRNLNLIEKETDSNFAQDYIHVMANICEKTVQLAQVKLSDKNSDLYKLLRGLILNDIDLDKHTRRDILAYLSVKAIVDTQQSDCVLVGMRRVDYVKDLLDLVGSQHQQRLFRFGQNKQLYPKLDLQDIQRMVDTLEMY